jgi:hypothetical protein
MTTRYEHFPVATADLDPEDAKIVRLARTALLRAFVPGGGVAQGAAVRDTDGRTYAAATVEHPDPGLTTSALRGALSAAYSSGARTFESLVVLATAPELTGADSALVAELAPAVPILLADESGAVRSAVTPASASPPADRR